MFARQTRETKYKTHARRYRDIAMLRMRDCSIEFFKIDFAWLICRFASRRFSNAADLRAEYAVHASISKDE